MWPIRHDLKQSLIVQMRHLARHADAGLTGFCGALLALDLFFIAVFSIYRIYAAFSSNDAPPLGAGWQIGRDWSYAETLGYVKLGIIVAALALVRGKRERPIYPALALIFAVTLMDDALRLHEQLGHSIANALALRSTLGELMVWTMYGVSLSLVMATAFVRSPQQDRTNGLLLLGAFAVLVLFAVLADFAHVVVLYGLRSRAVDVVFTVIEDGGEQITLSLISGLALLVHRELHSRQDRSFLSN